MTSFRRRFITAVVFLLLGIYGALGYFDLGETGTFVRALCNLFKGLFGWGYCVAPPLFVLAAVMLMIRYNKPWAIWRSVSLLGVIPVFGSIMHLIAGSAEPGGSLWQSGMELTSGGLLSGTLAELLVRLLSKAGAWIVLIPALLLLIAGGLDVDFRELFRRYQANAPAREKAREEREVVRQAEKAARYDERRIREMEREEERSRLAEERAAMEAGLSRKRNAYDFERDLAPGERGRRDAAPVSGRGSVSPSAERPLAQEDETPSPSNVDYFTRAAAARNRKIAENPDAFSGESNRNRRARGTSDPAGAVPSSFDTDVPAKTASEAPKSSSEDNPSSPSAATAKKEAVPGTPSPPPSYVYPPLDLLSLPVRGRNIDAATEARQASEQLEEAFRSFGVNLTVSHYTRGPNVTRYEAEIEPGTKLSKLINLEDDIALALGSMGVRIAAVPNKASTVGVEIPNRAVTSVYLREIIESEAFQGARSKLTFALGKSIAGEPEVGNINKLPHLLIAGTTGSGKSVCLNSLILSLLYKATPEEVRFILIDPKMVEFRIYNGIPHLMSPVVTDPKKAAGALQWAVVEMMKRYRLFSDENTRDIDSYNTLMEDRRSQGDENARQLPRIVVVIDELADLMMVAAKEVEDSICRVAQMGRAAGMHLVVATQSPRADVITGLIKANIPSRCALKVSSSLESRIILDSGGGAEKLIGNGDMLYAPIGTNKPKRIQGTWVSDEEREKVVDYLKAHGAEASYDNEMIDEMNRLAEGKGSGKSEEGESGSGDGNDPLSGYDELLPEAVDVALDAGQVSVSMLQRRLKLGYSRAARVVDQMEELGVIGPYEGAKPRQVRITRSQWQEMQMIQGTAPVEILPDDGSDVFPDYEAGDEMPVSDDED